MLTCGYPEELIKILQWMLTYEEKNRPTFAELVEVLTWCKEQGKWSELNAIEIVRKPEGASSHDEAVDTIKIQDAEQE